MKFMSAKSKAHALRGFKDSVNSLNAIYNPEPPTGGILYHYTEFAGLLGILESHSLWATYNRVLNDASEQIHAETVLRDELTRLARTKSSSLKGPIPNAPARKRFVTCFCESDALLSMWRSYAVNGGGYCLGFDYDHVRLIRWRDLQVGSSYPHLFPVHYGNTPDCIRTYLKAICLETTSNGEGMEELMAKLSPFFPSMIKHESFKEEREWRTIALDPPLEHIKFRSGIANIRPYVELFSLRGDKLPLVSITYGPMLRQCDQPEEIIGWMLQKNGYSGIEVKPSQIPFRL